MTKHNFKVGDRVKYEGIVIEIDNQSNYLYLVEDDDKKTSWWTKDRLTKVEDKPSGANNYADAESIADKDKKIENLHKRYQELHAKYERRGQTIQELERKLKEQRDSLEQENKVLRHSLQICDGLIANDETRVSGASLWNAAKSFVDPNIHMRYLHISKRYAIRGEIIQELEEHIVKSEEESKGLKRSLNFADELLRERTNTIEQLKQANDILRQKYLKLLEEKNNAT